MNNRHPFEKSNQNLGGCFGTTSQTPLLIKPIDLKDGPNWPNWQCCLAGSSKTAPRILIFSIAMDVEYSFYLKSIATYAPKFFGYNNLVLKTDFVTNFSCYSHNDLRSNVYLLFLSKATGYIYIVERTPLAIVNH